LYFGVNFDIGPTKLVEINWVDLLITSTDCHLIIFQYPDFSISGCRRKNWWRAEFYIPDRLNLCFSDWLHGNGIVTNTDIVKVGWQNRRNRPQSWQHWVVFRWVFWITKFDIRTFSKLLYYFLNILKTSSNFIIHSSHFSLAYERNYKQRRTNTSVPRKPIPSIHNVAAERKTEENRYRIKPPGCHQHSRVTQCLCAGTDRACVRAAIFYLTAVLRD